VMCNVDHILPSTHSLDCTMNLSPLVPSHIPHRYHFPGVNTTGISVQKKAKTERQSPLISIASEFRVLGSGNKLDPILIYDFWVQGTQDGGHTRQYTIRQAGLYDINQSCCGKTQMA